MASEDSDQFGSGFLTIHRLRDLRDVRKAIARQMMAGVDHLDA